MVFLGNPEFGCDLQPIDFAAYAQACGGAGYTIRNPAEAGAILDRALADPRPTIIEAIVDPNEPPLPPKVTTGPGQEIHRGIGARHPARRTHRLDRALGPCAPDDLRKNDWRERGETGGADQAFAPGVTMSRPA